MPHHQVLIGAEVVGNPWVRTDKALIAVRPHVADTEVVRADLRTRGSVEALAVDLPLRVRARTLAPPYDQILVGARVIGHR